MKKIIILLLMAVLALNIVWAPQPSCEDLGYDRTQDGGVGSIDAECQAAGFDFGIARWNWNGTAYNLTENMPGYTVSISGNADSATWTSDPAAAGSLSKEGRCYQDLPGGSSGTVDNIRYEISHLTLCGNYEEIPEFTTIGAILVLAVAGLYIHRKRY